MRGRGNALFSNEYLFHMPNSLEAFKSWGAGCILLPHLPCPMWDHTGTWSLTQENHLKHTGLASGLRHRKGVATEFPWVTEASGEVSVANSGAGGDDCRGQSRQHWVPKTAHTPTKVALCKALFKFPHPRKAIAVEYWGRGNWVLVLAFPLLSPLFLRVFPHGKTWGLRKDFVLNRLLSNHSSQPVETQTNV